MRWVRGEGDGDGGLRAVAGGAVDRLGADALHLTIIAPDATLVDAVQHRLDVVVEVTVLLHELR